MINASRNENVGQKGKTEQKNWSSDPDDDDSDGDDNSS